MGKTYYDRLTPEDHLQRACLDYAFSAYSWEPIALNTEHKRSPFERYLWKYLGGKAGTPDLFFPYARNGKNGMFVELKTEDRKVFGKLGQLLKNETHEAQYDTLERLRNRGYVAEFVFGFDQFKALIDGYAR